MRLTIRLNVLIWNIKLTKLFKELIKMFLFVPRIVKKSTSTSFRWLFFNVILERHNKELCFCDRCFKAFMESSLRGKRIGYINIKELSGCFYYYCVNNNIYYLKFFPDKSVKIQNKFYKNMQKRYSDEQITLLSSYIHKEMRRGYPAQSAGEIPASVILKFKTVFNKKIDEMPLYINSHNIYLKAFSKWRLHVGR